MTHYHQLSTQKYVDETMKQENEQLYLQKRREAIFMVAQFLFSVVVLIVTMIAVYTMPAWLPSVNALLENIGILQGG